MNRLSVIQDLYAYNRWANRHVMDAVAALPADDFTRDVGGSFPSVRDTLVHLIGSDWIWLSRWNGTSPTEFPDADGLRTAAAVRDRWKEIEDERTHFVDGRSVDDLDRMVAYRTSRGEAFENPLGGLLRHVVNHATYHRGQIAMQLRLLGHTPPSTDYVLWMRQQDA